MRYVDTGEIHKDFHLATNRTVDYIMRQYGKAFLMELSRRTAQKVYLNIYETLKAGDESALIEHLSYYIEREGGVIEIQSSPDTHVIRIVRCPMHEHINGSEQVLSEYMEMFLSFLYTSFAENTPFNITFTSYDPKGSYCITIKRQDSYVTQ